jgi:cytochrome c biogenesis protein CcmG, thiol:disulfide interchange protein DsbE
MRLMHACFFCAKKIFQLKNWQNSFIFQLYLGFELLKLGEFMMKKIIGVMCVMIIILIGIFITFKEKPRSVGVNIGDAAPDFELQTIDGQSVKLSDYKGKKVILNFWATWCPPCKEEMPKLEKYYDQKPADVELLAVNFTVTEKKRENVVQFVQKHQYSYPILLDEKNKVNSTYEILSLPTTYFIDSEGVIREKFTGPLTEKKIKNIISRLD